MSRGYPARPKAPLKQKHLDTGEEIDQMPARTTSKNLDELSRRCVALYVTVSATVPSETTTNFVFLALKSFQVALSKGSDYLSRVGAASVVSLFRRLLY